MMATDNSNLCQLPPSYSTPMRATCWFFRMIILSIVTKIGPKGFPSKESLAGYDTPTFAVKIQSWQIRCQSLPILFTRMPLFHPARPHQLFTRCQSLPSAHHMRCAGRSATATATAARIRQSDFLRPSPGGGPRPPYRDCSEQCALLLPVRACNTSARFLGIG